MSNTSRRDSRPGTVRLVEQRRVRRPQAEVFDYVSDFSNSAAWDPGVSLSRKVVDGPVSIGSRYELEVLFGNRLLPMTYEITAYEPPNRVVLVGRGDKIGAVDVIEVRADGGETVVDYTADLTFHGLIKYLVPVFGPTLRKVGKRALDGLVIELKR